MCSRSFFFNKIKAFEWMNLYEEKCKCLFVLSIDVTVSIEIILSNLKINKIKMKWKKVLIAL